MLFSFLTQRVFIQDWLNSNWITRVVLTHDLLNFNCNTESCSVSPFISHDQQSDECTRRRICLPLRNLYKCKQALYCVFCLRSSLKNCCCYLSAIFILHFVIGCLFLNSFLYFYTALCCCLFISLSPYFFYADVVVIFLFISCKHVNKHIIFVFGAFVYYFKNTISFFVTIFNLFK